MPAENPEKVQLNMFVPRGVNDLYREYARAAGYGKQPSNMLGPLLLIYGCFLQAFFKRLEAKHARDPQFFQSREQRFYAREIILLLGQVLDVPLEEPGK